MWFVGAAAVAAGRAHWRAAALVMVAVMQPLVAALVVGLLVARSGRSDDRRLAAEIRFHQRIISELRGGSAVRTALAAACAGAGELGLAAVGRRLTAGQSIDRLAATIGAQLPATGELAAAAIEFSVIAGGRAVDAFEVMAAMATEEAELGRELATAAAPGQFALLVVGGGPVAALLVLLVTGRITALMAFTQGPWLLGAGLALIGSGVAVAVRLGRGALR